MPTKVEIAHKTGFSRLTIRKHLKEYGGSDEFKERLEEYRFMKGTMIDQIMKAGLNGDLKAARLYMETVDKMAGLEKTTTVINQQNNYIQVNGVMLELQKLPEQLVLQIEEFVKGALERKE